MQEKNIMVITKKIYAKRKRVSDELFKEIFRLEIEQHLLKHRFIIFDRIDNGTKNNDGTITYNIHFKPTF